MAKPSIAGVTIWLTGLSGAGKSALAAELLNHLSSTRPVILDGDDVRLGLSSDLGFSRADRKENVRRIAEVAKIVNRSGALVIVAIVSPYLEDRAMAREIVGNDRFLEAYVSTNLSICEQRDPKGLYAKARAGQISNFTGISDPYEPPNAAEVTLDMGVLSLEQSAAQVVRATRRRFTIAG
jgi:adenylylsulfate kinase